MNKRFIVAVSLLLCLAGLVLLNESWLPPSRVGELPDHLRLTDKLGELAFSSVAPAAGGNRPPISSYSWAGEEFQEQWQRSVDDNGVTLRSPKLAFRSVLEIDSIVIRLKQGHLVKRFTIHWSGQPELTREAFLKNRREFTIVSEQTAQAFVLDGDDISDLKMLGTLNDEEAPTYIFLRSRGEASIESVDVIGKLSRFAVRSAGLDRQNLQGDIQDALYFTTPGRVSYTGQLPPGGHLVVGVHGLLPDAEAIRYRVHYQDARGQIVILDELLQETGGRQEFRVELPEPMIRSEPLEGTLTFEAETSTPGNVAFWSNPMVLGRDRAQRPNVILYVVDALRADHLGAYGYPKPTSPFLDRLARQGQVFDRCYAAASWTKPSIASLFTSLYPGTHGVGARSHADPLPDAVETLADYFRRSGYVTASFSANPQATTLSNLDQGFDYVFTPNAFPADRLGSKAGKVCADDLNTRVLPWIEAHQEDPFFIYVHSIDPHRPYLSRPVPASLARRTNDIDRYDAEIYLNDREIGRIHEKVEQLGLHEKTLFVVTSDHGESFGEHGRQGHGTGVYREEIRIPLILSQQGSIVPRRVADPAHLVDLMPTILTHCGISFDGGSMEGMDLLRGPSDRQRRRTIFAQRFTYPEDMEVEGFRGADSYAVIKDEWKLIVEQSSEDEAPRFQLYPLDEPETDQRSKPRQGRHGDPAIW